MKSVVECLNQMHKFPLILCFAIHICFIELGYKWGGPSIPGYPYMCVIK